MAVTDPWRLGPPDHGDSHSGARGSRLDLDAFIEAHAEGWDHLAWIDLVNQLDQNGFDVSDQAAVGIELDNRRLAWELRRRNVPGLGPKRIDAVVDRFGTLWSLQHADVEELAEIKTIPNALAEKVVAAVR